MPSFLELVDIFLVGLILSRASVRDFQAQQGEHHHSTQCLVKHSARQTAWARQDERFLHPDLRSELVTSQSTYLCEPLSSDKPVPKNP